MTRLKTTLVCALLAVSASAMADEPSYNFLQTHYTRANLEADEIGKSLKPDGYGFSGSYLFLPNFFVEVGSDSIDGSVYGAKVENNSSIAAVGFRAAIGHGTDVVLRAGYDWNDLKIRAGNERWSDDERTAFGSVGVRSRLNSLFEVGASATRYDGGNGWLKEIYGQLYLTDTVSLGVSHGRADDLDLTRLYARVNF